MRVLDLGSGDGVGSMVLAEAGINTCGVEEDRRLVRLAEARHRSTDPERAPSGTVSFVAGDPLEVLSSEAADEFDAIVAVSGLDPLRDKMAGLRRLRELVGNGVALVFAVPGSGGTAWDVEALSVLAAAAHSVETLDQWPLAGSVINQAGNDGGSWVASGTIERSPAAARPARILCANLREENYAEAVGAGHLGACVVQLDHDPVARLEAAIGALHAENSMLARERLGMGHTSAASRLAKIEQESRHRVDDANQRLGALDSEMKRFRAEALSWERSLRELESSRIVRLSRAYWALRARLRGSS